MKTINFLIKKNSNLNKYIKHAYYINQTFSVVIIINRKAY